MRKLFWPILVICCLVMGVVGFFTGSGAVKPQERRVAAPISPVSFKSDNESKLDEMLELVAGLSNEVLALKEREASGAIVVKDIEILQSEIAKLRTAIVAFTEKKETELAATAAAPADERNKELEAKIKALERKVKRLSKPVFEEPKTPPVPAPVIEWRAAPALPLPPPPMMTVMEVAPPPCQCRCVQGGVTTHQVIHRRSGIFGLGILGRSR